MVRKPPKKDEIQAPAVPARYEVRAVLGRGASGIVYRVFDRARSETLALKCVPDQDLNLAGEFLALSRIGPHPALARPVDYLKQSGFEWFSMELAPGIPLRRLMPDPGSGAFIGEVARQIAGGLAIIHRRGFIHGDLKPENVIVDITPPGRPSVKLVDLGLARPIEDVPAGGPLFGHAGGAEKRSDQLASLAGAAAGNIGRSRMRG